MKTRTTNLLKSGIVAVAVLVGIFLSFTAFSYISLEKGKGDIVRQTRDLKDFKGIKVSHGIEVVFKQSENEEVVVETYENLQSIIITKIENGVLRIYADENYKASITPKVYVSLKVLESLEGSSGSNLKGENLIKSKKLYVELSSASELELSIETASFNSKQSSGSEMNIQLESKEIYCDLSSGSSCELKGNSDVLLASASSGSEINAYNLSAKKCTISTSSGADAEIYISEEINAKASSGSEVTYKGNPQSKNIEISSGADVSKE